MGRYKAPANPYETFTKGCLRVYYPDSPLLFRALRAQLTELESRFLWDTDGDIAAAEKLEQDWLEAGKLTFEAIGTGCSDNAECEQTIIDLTLQLEQCQETIQEYENMNITVNCNCGCGACYTIPTDPNGDPFPTVPVNPNDPLETIDPTWNEVTETPPDGYDTWQDFVDDRCRASNWFVDSYLQIVKDMDLVERKLSLGGAVMEIVALLLAALPGPVGDWAGVVVIVKWVGRMVGLLADFVDDLEDFNDWLQTSSDAIEAHKEELVCAVYRMSSPDYIREFLLTFFAGYVSPELANAGYSANVVNLMRDLLSGLMDDVAKRAADGFANQYIPADYVPSVDCATCGIAPAGFTFVYASVAEITSTVNGSGTSNQVATIPQSDQVQLGFDATGANQYTDMNISLAVPPNFGSRYKGLYFEVVDTVNVKPDAMRILTTTAGPTGHLWDSTITNASVGKTALVRGSGTAVFVPAVDVNLLQQDGMNADSCQPAERDIRIGFFSLATGSVSAKLQNIKWIYEDAVAC